MKSCCLFEGWQHLNRVHDHRISAYKRFFIEVLYNHREQDYQRRQNYLNW